MTLPHLPLKTTFYIKKKYLLYIGQTNDKVLYDTYNVRQTLYKLQIFIKGKKNYQAYNCHKFDTNFTV